jgi:hypothetical protein
MNRSSGLHHKCQAMQSIFKEYFNSDYIKSFGICFSVFGYLHWALSRCLSERNRFYRFIDNWYYNKVKKFVTTNVNVQNDNFGKDVSEYDDSDMHNSVIWTMWWQGEKEAPLLVKNCIMQMRKLHSNRKVIVIDSENYINYVKLPPVVMEKFDAGKINPTKLSNMIRLSLLYNYGGVWVDSTIWLERSLEDDLFNKDWVSLKTNSPAWIWTTFFIGGRAGNPYFKIVLDMHYQWWKKYDRVITYLLFDCMLSVAYEKFENMREMVEKGTIKAGNCYWLMEQISKGSLYNKEEWERQISINPIFKLTYKIKLEERAGQTYLNYIISNKTSV